MKTHIVYWMSIHAPPPRNSFTCHHALVSVAEGCLLKKTLFKYSGKCYHFQGMDDEKTWQDANKSCYAGHLVDVRQSFEHLLKFHS